MVETKANIYNLYTCLLGNCSCSSFNNLTQTIKINDFLHMSMALTPRFKNLNFNIFWGFLKNE